MGTPDRGRTTERSIPSPDVSAEQGVDGRRFVRIAGNLPVGWLGSLSLGMAEAGLSIVRGRARRADRQRWELELELYARGRNRTLTPADYLLLARRRLPAAPRSIVVEDFSVGRDPERGALVLDVTGVDCLGFLGSLLERLTGLLLFPIELHIETIGSHAVDRLWLQGLGETEPSAVAERMLASLLEGLRRADPINERPTRMSLPARQGPTFVSLAPRECRERDRDC